MTCLNCQYWSPPNSVHRPQIRFDKMSYPITVKLYVFYPCQDPTKMLGINHFLLPLGKGRASHGTVRNEGLHFSLTAIVLLHDILLLSSWQSRHDVLQYWLIAAMLWICKLWIFSETERIIKVPPKDQELYFAVRAKLVYALFLMTGSKSIYHD